LDGLIVMTKYQKMLDYEIRRDVFANAKTEKKALEKGGLLVLRTYKRRRRCHKNVF